MLEFTEKYRKQGDIEVSPMQEEGINFLLARGNALLCFQTGAGKTITSLVTSKIILDNFDKARILIVMPVKALKAFRSEITKRLNVPREEIGVIATSEMDFDVYRNKYFLVTDTNIGKYGEELLREITEQGLKVVLIVDECHKLADKNSQFYKTMTEIKKQCSICYGLSATPLINDLDGLYNTVSFFVPKFLGTKTEFDNRYTKWHLEDVYIKGGKGKKRKTRVVDGYINLDELGEKLKQVLIVRGKDYDIKFSKQFRDMTTEEHEVYEKVSSGILTNSKDDERSFSKRMHDLQRFIDRAYEGDDSIVELAKEYNATQFSTKEDLLVSTLKAALSKGLSTIIYCDYKDTVERLHSVLKSHRVELGLGRIYEITGSINIKEREQVEERIAQNDVVLITSAGTESINLQRCSCVMFYDIPFSSKQIIQCIGRVTRVDTKHPTQYIIFLGCNDSIDEYKYLLFQQHLDMIQRSINVGTNIPLENIDIDNKLIKELREKLLWKYKGDPIKKKLRKEKKELKARIRTCKLADSNKEMASNKFLIEPLDNTFDMDLKAVQSLYPDSALYTKFINGEIPFTVLRSNYVDFLHSEKGMRLLYGLKDGVLKSGGDLILVGNTELTEVLKSEVLEILGV